MNTETFERLLKQAVPDGKTIREIRIRTEKPVMILLESGENLLFSDGTCGKTESYGKKKMGSLEIREDRSVVLADQELIRGILETCSRHSLYAYEREISQGFLTESPMDGEPGDQSQRERGVNSCGPYLRHLLN